MTGGSFSPDGKFLALQVSSGNTGDGGELGMTIEVRHGRQRHGWRPCPAPWSAATPWSASAGRPAGDRLVAEFSFTTKMQLASWQPGAAAPP